MKKQDIKSSAINLTDLAIGIIVLGIVVTIGAIVLTTMRDSRLTDLDTYSTVNESITATDGGATLDNTWFSGITSIINGTGNETITASGNYSTSVNDFGTGTVTWVGASSYNGSTVKATYNAYNTSRPDWALADDAATGLGEYGNWFKIIVIVGVASVVLSLIFLSFGKRQGEGIGGTY